MKIKWSIATLIIAILDILAALLLKDSSVLMAITICLITCIGGMSVYFLFKSSLQNMQEQVKEVEEENKQVENIRTEFVANVSHELKTPLTSISGFIETLQAGAVEDPETRDRFIEIIAIETARLKRLIDDILVLSDIESSMDMSEQNINVCEVIDDIAEVLSPIANKRKISIINETDKTLSLVGSEDKFRQMLLNLIENAIKYGKMDGHVWIIGKETDKQKIITVKDDGIGIEKKDLERIAERFYRVDKSRSTKVGGTGLGLSIVKHTATLFNGRLDVKSKLGVGSEFSIIIEKN